MKKTVLILIPVLLLLAAFRFTFPYEAYKADLFAAESENFTFSVTTPQTTYDVTNFTTRGYQVLKNGEPFFAKGVGYQPVPIGVSPNSEPYGDYYTTNYKYIWQSDIDKMHDMHVNAIKIYSWFPDRDHNDFLNYAYSKGIYVIVGYYMPQDFIFSKFEEMKNNFKTIATNTASHPGMMGYQLGNENVDEGNSHNPEIWNRLNQIAALIKQIAPNKLITTGLVDDIACDKINFANNTMSSLDTWGSNLFRGKTLGPFYSDYKKASHKPVFITELGFPNSYRINGQGAELPDNGELAAEYSEAVVKEILDNSSDDEPDDPVAGIFWFMWCDEWWKQNCPACWGSPCPCSLNTQDFGPQSSYTDNFPGKYWDEEWFGLYTASDRRPRATVEVLKNLWK